MNEKIETPNNRINAHTSRSKLLTGRKSPNPMVVKEVSEKYVDIITSSTASLCSRL